MQKFPINYMFLALGIVLFVVAYQNSAEMGYLSIGSQNPAVPNNHAGLSCLGFALAGGLCCFSSALCTYRRSPE